MKSGCSASKASGFFACSRPGAGRDGRDPVVPPPHVAAVLHHDLGLPAADTTEDDDLLDRRRLFDRDVCHLLQRHDVAPPPRAGLA